MGARRPGEEDQMLNTTPTPSLLRTHGESTRPGPQAADSAVRADAKETAAQWLAFQAIRESGSGQRGPARQAVARALALAPGRDVRVLSALALARAGESTQSKAILEALKKSEPSNTFLKVYWFPVIEASMRSRNVRPTAPSSPSSLPCPTNSAILLRNRRHIASRIPSD